MIKNINLALLGLSLIFSACSTEELVLPDKVKSNQTVGKIDVIVKPTDVKIEGTYDNTFVIKWPQFSDKIEKVILSYDDSGTSVTKDVLDFSTDLSIVTKSVNLHTFKFVSVAKDGRATSPVLVEATNKGLYIDELLVRSNIEYEGKFVTQVIPNPLKQPLKIIITYPSGTSTAQEVISSSEERVTFTFNGTGTSTNSIKLILEDAKKNTVSKSVDYVLTPKLYSATNDKVFWTPYSNVPYGAGYGAVVAIAGNTNIQYTGSTALHTYYVHFTKTRAISGNGLWNADDVKKPSGPFNLISITGISLTINAWGTNPTKYKLYGIREDRSEVVLNDLLIPSFSVNTVVNVPAISNNATPFIGFRLDMSRETGNCQFALVEINLSGFPE